MGFGDFFLGRRSEKWYRKGLEKLLIALKEKIDKIHKIEEELQDKEKIRLIRSPKRYMQRFIHSITNVDNPDMNRIEKASSLKESAIESMERILEAIREMEKYKYRYMDLCSKYGIVSVDFGGLGSLIMENESDKDLFRYLQ